MSVRQTGEGTAFALSLCHCSIFLHNLKCERGMRLAGASSVFEVVSQTHLLNSMLSISPWKDPHTVA